MSEHVEVPVYALGQPSKRTGLGGLSLKTTIVGGLGFLIFLVCQMAGMQKLGFLVVLPITIVVALLVSVNFAGRSVAQTVQMTVQDMRRRSKGEHIYVAGPTSRVPGGAIPPARYAGSD